MNYESVYTLDMGEWCPSLPNTTFPLSEFAAFAELNLRRSTFNTKQFNNAVHTPVLMNSLVDFNRVSAFPESDIICFRLDKPEGGADAILRIDGVKRIEFFGEIGEDGDIGYYNIICNDPRDNSEVSFSFMALIESGGGCL